MKKLAFLLALITATFVACEPENEPNPAVEGVSKVVSVSYPTVTLNGAPVIHIPVNGTYTDPGATLTDDVTGAVTQITFTSSELDVTTPGIYAITYEAKNANGFLASATRAVLVLDYTPPVGLDPNHDISGPYLRAATGIICNVYKMDNGLYVTDNVGGSTANPAVILTPDVTSIDIPQQTTFHGLALHGQDEIFTAGPPITLVYKVIASGYGTGNRTFVHQ